MSEQITKDWNTEVENNKRFKFGSNWKKYSKQIGDHQLKICTTELVDWLGADLQDKSFLDIGCGSGIHSMAATSLGANVFSFDYDIDSVECTRSIKDQFSKGKTDWNIEQGSVLDETYMSSIGKFDIVYSWGVLHHTGEMWKAISNSILTVKDGGRFFIAIYNKQAWKSKFWWYIKSIYNMLPNGINKIYGMSLGLFFSFINILKYTLLLQPMKAIRPLMNYKKNRGMSFYHDIIDWMGGFPYEYATYQELNNFFEEKGFKLVKGTEATSLGCHQMVFQKVK